MTREWTTQAQQNWCDKMVPWSWNVGWKTYTIFNGKTHIINPSKISIFGYWCTTKNLGFPFKNLEISINSPLCFANFLVSPLYILLHGEIHHFIVDSFARHKKNLEIHFRKTIHYKSPLEMHYQGGYLRGFVYASPMGVVEGHN